jgi:hypothetical protein
MAELYQQSSAEVLCCVGARHLLHQASPYSPGLQ